MSKNSIDIPTDMVMNLNIMEMSSASSRNNLSICCNDGKIVYNKYKNDLVKKYADSWLTRTKLSRFPVVLNKSNKIYEVVPLQWLIMKIQKKEIGTATKNRFERTFDEDSESYDPYTNMSESLTIQTEEYVRVQLVYNPNTTVEDYINSISEKVNNEAELTEEKWQELIELKISLPKIISILYTVYDLEIYGY